MKKIALLLTGLVAIAVAGQLAFANLWELRDSSNVVTCFVDDSSNLTDCNLDASDITIGEVADARLSSNVSLLDTEQTYTSTTTYQATTNATELVNFNNSSAVEVASVTAAGDIHANSFSGDGSGLTNITAATADALSSDPNNCSAGEGAGGIQADGTAEDCVDYIEDAGDTMTGVLQTSDGSQALPGLAMNADTDTGVDSLASDSLNLIAGGVVSATATITGLDVRGLTEAGSATLTNSIDGNAGTATALAADGADCASGELAIGVDASGAATCVTTDDAEINGSTSAVTSNALFDHDADASAHHAAITEFEGRDTTANICADIPAQAGNWRISSDDFDLYTSTGLTVGSWRNSRTGTGPC